MHPADLPPLPLTLADLRDMDARLPPGRSAPEDAEDGLVTLKPRPRMADPVDGAIDALDLESGDSFGARIAVDGPSGRPPARRRVAVPAAPSGPAAPANGPAPAAVDAEAGAQRTRTPVRAPPPPVAAPSAPPTAAAAREDSLDDIVDELVADDQRATEARRRAAGLSARLAWWEELFDAEWLALVPARPARAVEAEAALFARALNLSAGARVLDVACGDGRHAIELAKLGCDVVGYDLSRDMVAAAERNARQAGVPVTFVRDDMRAPQHVTPGFDAVLCAGTSFGYFDDGQNVETLAQMRRMLKRGSGPVLIHGLNRDHAVGRLPDRTLWRHGDHVLSEDADFDALTSRLHVHRQVVSGDGAVRDWQISIRLYAAHELRHLMRALECAATAITGPPVFQGRYLGAQCREISVLGLWR